jgi:hypothetical protein
MQSAKDTFFLALRERLAALNPERTLLADGAVQPAVVVAENLPASATPPLPDVFCLRWGGVSVAAGLGGTPQPLLALECSITYFTAGDAEHRGAGRGRALAELDGELLRICAPPHAPKVDATQAPASSVLPSRIVWTVPQLGEAEGEGATLRRTARVTVFVFPEGALA